MRILQALLLACCISFSGNAQILAVDPTMEGGFETGTTFALNGWTVVNPATVVHQWVVDNNAPGYTGGLRGAHVSNNGSAYLYTVAGGARTCHFYRDVTIPAGSVAITLKFYWKGSGQIGSDRLLVYTAPTSVTPVANVPVSPATAITGATLIWTQTTLAAAYTLETITLPATFAGTTFRLIFTWENDATVGVSPPAAVDNISVSYNCGAPAAISGSSTICEGSSSALSDPSPGGTWSSSNPAVGTISASGVVAAILAGTTTISYTTTCAAPATLVVTVLAGPVAIVGPSNVCIGSTILLANASLGGGWTSMSPSVASVNAAGIVSGLAIGTATIVYSNGCGISATKVVTVRPLPGAIVGADSVCEGATGMFTDPTPGGTWSTSSSAIATASGAVSDTSIITGVADGTVTITYTTVYGCIATKAITVDPLPEPILGVVPFCVGGSITVTNALPGGVWASSGVGVASISPTGGIIGLAGGTSVISYSNGCGSATVLVSVDALPVAIIGTDPVCVGSTTTYADIVIGGTWVSAFPAIATVLSGSGLITGVSPGVSIITYTMPGGCYITRPVEVVDVPGTITGPMSLCPGATVTLGAPVSGGTWLSLNPSYATVNAVTGVVTGIAADTALIKYTTPVGCVVYATVTVNPLPSAIIGHSTFCATDRDTLYNADPGGTWTTLTPGIASVGGISGVMTTLSGGIATIRYTLPTGCSTTKSFTVNALPNPVVTFNDATNTLQTGTGYVTYQWYHSLHGIVVGATIYKTAGLYNGNYFVVVTDTNGCENASNPFAYNTQMAVSGINTSHEVVVYPNPVNNILYINSDRQITAVISGIDGKTMLTKENAHEVNLANLPNGLYFLSLYDEHGMKIKVEKLTKQ